MLLTHKRTQSVAVLLNDLVKINNDRIACYKQAITQLQDTDADLKALFETIIQEAIGLKEELSNKLRGFGADAANNATISGMVHMAWLDLKAALTGLRGTSRNSTLSFCLYNEEMAQQAYNAA